jgi:hypothetical protein
MSKLEDLLDAEAKAAEQAEESGHVDEALPEHVRVTRGHPRARTLQIRLRDEEFSELEALAADRGLPVSTVARQILLQSLAPEEDLKGVLDRLERDLSALRRKALSA